MTRANSINRTRSTKQKPSTTYLTKQPLASVCTFTTQHLFHFDSKTDSLSSKLLLEKSVHLLHGFLLHCRQHMRIHIRCCTKVAMSEKLLNHLHRNTHT